MSDILAERCAAFADVAIDLMRVTMECQNNPVRLNQVSSETARVRAVIDLGTDGILNELYLRWYAAATATLDEMDACAERGDPRGVWAAFTDPVKGLDGLGKACAGYPRW